MSQTEMMTLMMQAAQGDRSAIVRVLGQALPRLHDTIKNARREVTHRRETEWDEEATREAALNGEIPPEVARESLSDLMESVLMVCAYTPLALLADEEEADDLDEIWQNSVYNLLVKLHNPTIRLSLIAQMDEEVREEMDEYTSRMATELWGTALAVTKDGKLGPDDFPTETEHVIREISKEWQKKEAQAEALQDDDDRTLSGMIEGGEEGDD